MPVTRKHPITGCRYDTVFGTWAIVSESVLNNFVDIGWSLIERGELTAVQLRSQEMTDHQKENPYVIEDGIARINVSGPMTKVSTSMSSVFGGTGTIQVQKALKLAMGDNSVHGVFLEIDSPGGTVEGTQELANAVRKLNMKKPVFIHAPDNMTSAAQWVGAMGRFVSCGPTANCGSVGVKIALMDNSNAPGGKPLVITTGEFKDVHSAPFTPTKIAEIKRGHQAVLDVFWGEILASRPKTEKFKEEILTARVFVGQDAVRVGLVDVICSTDEAFERAKEALKTPTPARGSGMQDSPKAAPIRSKPMPTTLTDHQLANLAKLPGGAGVTADNADHVAYNVASNAHAENTALKQRVTELDTALTTAKANAAPAPMDPALLRDRCETAIERLQIKLEKDKITSAQFTTMAAALLTSGNVDKDGKLSADAKPDETMFQKVDGKYRYEKAFAALDENEPNGIVKSVTGAQPAPRAEPGKVAADAPQVPTLARVNELNRQYNEREISEDEYFEQYPEARNAAK